MYTPIITNYNGKEFVLYQHILDYAKSVSNKESEFCEWLVNHYGFILTKNLTEQQKRNYIITAIVHIFFISNSTYKEYNTLFVFKYIF